MKFAARTGVMVALLMLQVAAQDAASIAASYRRALGNAGTLAHLQSLGIVGKLSSADGSWKRTYRMWIEGTKVRSELVLQPGLVATNWTDGANGWSIQPWTQSLVPQPLNRAAQWRLQLFAHLFRNDLLDTTAQLEYLGKEELEGGDCYKVRARHVDGSSWTYYLDPDVGLLVLLQVETTINGEDIEWSATFGNYQRVDDVLLPMELNTSSGLLLVERYELNPTLDAALFAPPNK
jgi:hypothetical protein